VPQHAANKPSWFCPDCRAPWPCQPARDRMETGGIDTSLRMAAWSMLEEAAHDMPHASGAELYERFIGWMRDVPDGRAQTEPTDSAMNNVPNALAWDNRRILAERLNWPNGALETCEQVEQESPEWHITYSAGGNRTWNKAGFYAQRKAAWRPEPALYGASASELEAAIAEWQPPSTYTIRAIRTDEEYLADKRGFPEIIGVHEIGERIGCNRDSVEEIARSGSFPPPAATLAQGSVWLTSDVENWVRTNLPIFGMERD
jgi:predicted DNA-binding transcriptional regulator AlpA